MRDNHLYMFDVSSYRADSHCGKPYKEEGAVRELGASQWRSGFGLSWLPLAFLAIAVSGCSMSMPIASLTSSAANEDATGSIPASSLARLLDAEDWRRAKAALATALDPQGNDSLVGWDNPKSGNKGSFTPIGKAYPSDGKICRVFLSRIDRKGNEQSMKGTACSERDGEWTIAEINPSKKA